MIVDNKKIHLSEKQNRYVFGYTHFAARHMWTKDGQFIYKPLAYMNG